MSEMIKMKMNADIINIISGFASRFSFKLSYFTFLGRFIYQLILILHLLIKRYIWKLCEGGKLEMLIQGSKFIF